MNNLLVVSEDDFYSFDEEEISLTEEQVAEAAKISDRASDPELRWQVYLNALAFYGFEAWLKERDDELKIDTSKCQLLSGSPVIAAATHLKINGFNVCVVAKNASDGDYVSIPQSILKNPTETAQFYIIAEVIEEMSEVLMYGFLRADRLEQYYKADPLGDFSDGTCDLPTNWLNLEFDELISYFRCFNPSAIALPKLVTADNNIWASISTQEIENISKELDIYSSDRSRQQGLINYLSMRKLIPIIQQNSREPKLYLPQDSADRMASIWDVVNGFSLTVGGYKLVVIPSESSDAGEFSIPQEWVDIPAWHGDYYLAVKVDLEVGELRVWGYTSHQEVKQPNKYVSDSRSYCLTESEINTDVNLLWTEIERGVREVVNLVPVPELTFQRARSLIEQLSTSTANEIRNSLDFSDWAGIVQDARWRTKLYQARTVKLRSSQKGVVENLISWGYGIWSQVWDVSAPAFRGSSNIQSRSTTRSVNSNPLKSQELVKILASDASEEELQRAISELEQVGIGDLEEINALECLIDDIDRTEKTRWKAADSLAAIDPSYPSAGIRRDILYEDLDVTLQLDIIRLLRHEFAIRFAVLVHNASKLPEDLEVFIIEDDKITPIRKEPNSTYVEARLIREKNEHFTISIKIGQSEISKEFTF